MKIKAFKKLYNAICELEDEVTNWLQFEDEVKKNRLSSIAIFDTNGHIISSIGIAFLEELDVNILKSSQGKIDLIKFYLYELKNTNRFFDDPKLQKIIYRFGIYDDSFSIRDNLIVAIHYIYIFITTEIQYCCLKYNIDFISVCKDVDFDCSSINNIFYITTKAKKKEKKKNVLELKKNQNPFPQIFNCDDNRAYNVFKDWSDGITDKFLDYSFIFQKMISSQENLIRKKYPHLSFMLFLKEYDFINQKEYDSFIDKASFSTRTNTATRLTRYFLIKDKHYPPITDKSVKKPEVRK